MRAIGGLTLTETVYMRAKQLIKIVIFNIPLASQDKFHNKHWKILTEFFDPHRPFYAGILKTPQTRNLELSPK